MAFQIQKWGPYRGVLGAIEKRINEITPIAGLGISVDESPGGSQISATSGNVSSGGANSGPRSSASGSVDLYGAHNGAPALFHLKEAAPPTPL